MLAVTRLNASLSGVDVGVLRDQGWSEHQANGQERGNFVHEAQTSAAVKQRRTRGNIQQYRTASGAIRCGCQALCANETGSIARIGWRPASNISNLEKLNFSFDAGLNAVQECR